MKGLTVSSRPPKLDQHSKHGLLILNIQTGQVSKKDGKYDSLSPLYKTEITFFQLVG